MISVRGVTKRFGAQLVLYRVNLEIEPGKTTAIVGPSGVGKSVLLKLIMGIMEPDEGEIFVGGESITRAKSEEARNQIRLALGVLFQSAALFDSLTVYDNIAFALRERARVSGSLLRPRAVHDRVVHMLSVLDLAEHAFHLPQEVSMGMRKRIGLARSLITEPKVLLFDEPNTGLDPLVGQEVYDLIKRCRAKWGFTGVVISHELPEVFQVCDRVAMLLNSRFIFEGSPTELVESSDPAVQQFLKGRTDGPIRIQ